MKNVERDSLGTVLTYQNNDLVGAGDVYFIVRDHKTQEKLSHDGDIAFENAGEFEFPVDSEHCQWDRVLVVTLSHDPNFGQDNIEDIVFFNMYTPYVTVDLVREHIDSASALTDEKIQAIEFVVQSKIDSYVGYAFSKRFDVFESYGDDTDVLPVIRNIVEVHRIYEDDELVYEKNGVNDLGDIEVGFSDRRIRILGPVLEWRDRAWIGRFRYGRQYKVAGVYGFSHVPKEVENAALLIFEDILCNDFPVKNSNASSFKTGTHTINYYPSLAGTGNLLVNEMLSKYRRSAVRMV